MRAGGGGTSTAPLELVEQQVGGNASAATEGDGGAIPQGRGVAPAAVSRSEDFWVLESSLDTEALFSQQFQLQQRSEDLHQEMIRFVWGSAALPPKYAH